MRWFFAILLCLLPLAVSAQEDDRGRLTRFLEENLSGAGRVVTVTGFRGALSSRAQMDRLTIADEQGIWITLNDIVLDWSRLAVLSGNIQINELSAGEILIDRLPAAAPSDELPSPEAPGFALPELPVAVNIGRLAAGRIVLGPTVLGQPVTGRLESALSLSGGEGQASLELVRTDNGPAGRVALQGSYSNATRQLVFTLDATEGAGGIAATLLDIPGTPAASLAVQGAGPLSDFAADLRLATDGVDRLTGKLTLREDTKGARRFVADLNGDLAPLVLPEHAAFFGPDVRLQAEGAREPSGRMDLTRLSVSARALTLDGSLTLAADGLPERAALTGRLALPDGGPVLLPISAESPTEVQSADITLSFDATQDDGWTARADVNGLTRPDLTITRLTLDGSGRIARAPGGDAPPVLGGTFAYAATGLAPVDAALATALGPQIAGKATLHWQAGAGAVTIGRATIDGADYALAVRGQVQGLGSGYQADGAVTGQAADLSRFAGIAGVPLSGAAQFDLTGGGSPLGGSFDIDLRAEGTDLAAGIAELDNLLRGGSAVRLAIARGEGGTTLREFSASTATGASLRAAGQLATAGSDLTADLDFPDLSALGGPYRGALRGQATLKGTPDAGLVTLTGTGRDLATGFAEADGLLRGESTLDIALDVQGRRIGITRAEIATPQGQVTAAGTYDPAGSDLRADFALTDLAALGPSYGGALQGAGTFTGTPAQGKATLSGTGRDLALGIAQADALLRGDSALDVALTLDGNRIGIDRATIGNPQITATVTGYHDPAGSDLTADLTLPSLAVIGPGYGGSLTANARATGTLQSGTLALDGTGRGLTVAQPEADRILRGDSTIRLRAALEGGQIKIEEAQLRNPQIDATATGSATGTRRDIAVEARLVNLALLVPEFPGPLRVSGTLADDGTGYGVALRALGPGGIDATATGRVAPNFTTADLRLDGTAQAGLANAFLGQRAISGQVGFDLRLNGPFALSSLSGPVRLTGGRLSDPSLPFSLTDLAATATLSGQSARVEASATSTAGGGLTASGTVALAAPYGADLTVTLRDLRLRDPNLYDTRIAGELRVTGPLTGGGQIGGTINLGVTELRIPSTGLGGTGDLPGLRHIAEPAPVRLTRQRAGLLGEATAAGSGGSGNFALDLTVRALNQVFVRGRGLDAEFGGSVRLGGTTANVVASGGFELVRGRLDILGKRLNLSRATITLQGDLIPTLDIVASNESEGVTSSVIIEGRADQPVVRFEASPELPEEEVIARLLFGKGLQNISAFQAAQLASAIATLAGRGGDGIVGRLRQGFGLDDLDVATDAEGETTLRAGKYLSRNVYTQVEVEAGGKTRINLNLDLRRGVTARGSIDSDGAAGIGVYIERDY